MKEIIETKMAKRKKLLLKHRADVRRKNRTKNKIARKSRKRNNHL